MLSGTYYAVVYLNKLPTELHQEVIAAASVRDGKIEENTAYIPCDSHEAASELAKMYSEKYRGMNKEEIWDAICDLALSQGFYGRLARDIENSGMKDEILADLEKQNFANMLDMVLFFEQG